MKNDLKDFVRFLSEMIINFNKSVTINWYVTNQLSTENVLFSDSVDSI